MKTLSKIVKSFLSFLLVIGFCSDSNAQWQLSNDYGASIDATAFSSIQQSVLFFNGYTLKYSSLVDKTEYEPVALNVIEGWDETWENVDAAFGWDESTVFVFMGSKYQTIDLENLAVTGAGEWAGIPTEWDNQIDAAVRWNNENILFFLGGQYYSYNLTDNTSTEADFLSNWEGWPAEWTDGFSSCLNVGDGNIHFFKEDNYVTYNLETASFLEVQPVVAE